MVPRQLKTLQPLQPASKMAEINAKLDKMLQVVAEFDAVKTRVTQLEEENKQLKLAAENTAI